MLFDTYVAIWDSKYEFNAWRPFTAVREADSDGNPRTVANPNWTPLRPTPPHPEYASAHTAACAASFGVLERTAAAECADSRVRLGWHFRDATDAGLVLGRDIARHTVRQTLGRSRYNSLSSAFFSHASRLRVADRATLMIMRALQPVIFGAALTLAASTAHAQTIKVMECGPRIGVTLGAASNGDRNHVRPGTFPESPAQPAPDIAASAEFPIVNRWSARADVGSAAWTFQQSDPWGTPLLREHVRLSRAMLSALKQSPVPCGAPVRVYMGFGLGVYRYHFPDQRVNETKGGAHVLFGFELQTHEHLALAVDTSMHAIGGPRRDPVFSYTMFVFRLSGGVRVTF